MNSHAKHHATRDDAPTSNGGLDRLDGRYAVARELRVRFGEACADLGGADYFQRSLIERALWLEHWIADQERALLRGEACDTDHWLRAVDNLERIYSRLPTGDSDAQPDAANAALKALLDRGLSDEELHTTVADLHGRVLGEYAARIGLNDNAIGAMIDTARGRIQHEVATITVAAESMEAP